MSSLRQRYLQREHADFKGLNKTERVPFPKPKKIPDHQLSSDGSTADNGKLREETLDEANYSTGKARRESTMAKNVKRSQEGVPVTAPKPINVKSKKGRVATKLDNSLEGLARRRKNSGEISMLMPQAEAYAAPNTGNNNYAQNLPAGTDTARKPVKRSVKKGDLASTQDSVAENHFKDQQIMADDDAHEHHYNRGFEHGMESAKKQPPKNADHAYSYHMGYEHGQKAANEEVITDIDQLQPIIESYALNMDESKQFAWNRGHEDGLRGNELPTKISHARFGEHQPHYHAGVAVGNAQRIKELNHGGMIHVGEELKVGDDDQEQKKVRGTNTIKGKLPTVKRKYLGNQRGRTATGKPAHVIDVQPVVGPNNKTANRTTPSGERKKG